jgi:hypothetical protein
MISAKGGCVAGFTVVLDFAAALGFAVVDFFCLD